MPADDMLACAALCEEKGFERPSALFRALGEGRGRAYMVAARGWLLEEYLGDYEDDRLECRRAFLDREAAERYALGLNVRGFRRLTSYGIHLFGGYGNGRQRRDFAEQVAEILGVPYEPPTVEGEPLFPPSATDEQLERILQRFPFRFYDLVEVEIAP